MNKDNLEVETTGVKTKPKKNDDNPKFDKAFNCMSDLERVNKDLAAAKQEEKAAGDELKKATARAAKLSEESKRLQNEITSLLPNI